MSKPARIKLRPEDVLPPLLLAFLTAPIEAGQATGERRVGGIAVPVPPEDRAECPAGPSAGTSPAPVDRGGLPMDGGDGPRG